MTWKNGDQEALMLITETTDSEKPNIPQKICKYSIHPPPPSKMCVIAYRCHKMAINAEIMTERNPQLTSTYYLDTQKPTNCDSAVLMGFSEKGRPT